MWGIATYIHTHTQHLYMRPISISLARRPQARHTRSHTFIHRGKSVWKWFNVAGSMVAVWYPFVILHYRYCRNRKSASSHTSRITCSLLFETQTLEMRIKDSYQCARYVFALAYTDIIFRVHHRSSSQCTVGWAYIISSPITINSIFAIEFFEVNASSVL